MTKLVEKHWDYSKHAEFYKYRPNYSPQAIDMFIDYVGANKLNDFLTADIGAGTGNLTIMLLERGLKVNPVEPNDEMRNIGIDITKEYNTTWTKGTGTETTLESNKYNWVTFGSSFNVIDRELGLKETYLLQNHLELLPCGCHHCAERHVQSFRQQ